MIELVAQLSRIFKGLLGCTLEFRFKHEIAADIWNIDELETLSREKKALPDYVISKVPGLFAFPVAVDGNFTGLIIVNNWPKNRTGAAFEEDRTKLFQLSELVVMIVEARLKLAENTSSNVISFSKLRQVKARIPVSELPSEKTPLLNQPLLIQLNGTERVEKIAIDLHELTGRWAFLSINDMPDDLFESKEEIRALGAVTLFIRDLSSLSLERQAQLNAYLALPPAADTPHFVAMVPSNPQALIAAGQLSEALYSKFSFTQIQWAENESPKVVRATLQQILERTQIVVGKTEVQPTAKFLPFHPKFFESETPTLH